MSLSIKVIFASFIIKLICWLDWNVPYLKRLSHYSTGTRDADIERHYRILSIVCSRGHHSPVLAEFGFGVIRNSRGELEVVFRACLTFLKAELPVLVVAGPTSLLEAVIAPRLNKTVIIFPNVIPKAQVLAIESPEDDRSHPNQGVSVRDAPTFPDRVCSRILHTDVIGSVKRKSEKIITDRTFFTCNDSFIRVSSHAQDLENGVGTPFTRLLEDNFRILRCVVNVEEDSED